MRRFLLVLAAIGTGFQGIPPRAEAADAGPAGGDSAYVASVTTWRAEREARLRSATGWLTVAGFFWLDEGPNAVGAEPGSRVLLPADAAPARAGVLHVNTSPEGVEFTMEAYPGAGIERDSVAVTADVFTLSADGVAPVYTLGRLSFWVIPRGDRYAVRLRDPECALRKEFTGIDAYPVDPAWRVEGRLEPLPQPLQVPVPNIMGYVDTMLTPGPVRFVLGDTTLTLVPLVEAPADSNLWFIFQDATSGIETYGAGRFLYADLLPDGRVVVDFNRAYNPPCAFNPHTTCPLPPEGNVLPRSVRAGEKAYGDLAHPPLLPSAGH